MFFCGGKNMIQKNKMSYTNMNKLIWTMGLPMVLSMILQAFYNVVDTAFVINSTEGTLGNAALTAAFPIQGVMISIAVGTGIGINAMLSRNLGEGNKENVSKVVGNGIFLAIVLYVIYAVLGFFLAKPYMLLMSDNETVIELGTKYLKICCCFSIGISGFGIFERFLQATGKTTYSMVAQITGAVTNIILDALFIMVFKWGVVGAALATVIGQILSLLMAMYCHYFKNKEIVNDVKYIKPEGAVIKSIYKMGLPAVIMQTLLSVMMFVVLLVIKVIDDNTTVALLTNTFGIYYKIMSIAQMAIFGLSNALITIVAFNYGMKNKERVEQAVKWGIINSIIVVVAITILFQSLAGPISELFGLALPDISADGIKRVDIISGCKNALRIASVGYVFMAFSVGAQGILQGTGSVYKPLIISALRLIIFVIPFAFIFVLREDAPTTFYITFPIAEALTAVVTVTLIITAIKKLDYSDAIINNLIITISRTHGSGGKEIAKRLALALNYSFYDKENYVKTVDDVSYELYQSKSVNTEAILAQSKELKKIATKGNAVICGRAADFVLRNDNIVSVFISASLEYRVNRVMELYNDSNTKALKNIKKSDEQRAFYYSIISGQTFGEPNNYNIVLDASDGIEVSTKRLIKLIEEINHNQEL